MNINDHERINGVLAEVGRRDGVEGMSLSPDGILGLELSDGSNLQFEWREKFRIYTPLHDLPYDQPLRLAISEALAGLNRLSLYRGTLMANSETTEVVYEIQLDIEKLDADQLYNAIDILFDERPAALARLEEVIAQTIKEKTPIAIPIAFQTEELQMRKDKPWLEELYSLEEKGIRFHYWPCSEKDIAEVERFCNKSLPSQYRKFLAHTGRGSDLLFVGEDVFFPALLSFNERANELLLANESKCLLPKDAFVFLIHQNLQFFFFNLNGAEDPVIYSYEEGSEKFTQVYESFSLFMQISIAGHAQCYETIRRIHKVG